MSNTIPNNFFNRKEKKAAVIPEAGDYDPSNMENDLASCGITDIESFSSRHDELFSNLVVNSQEGNPVATVAKSMEEKFSKRELAFLISKDLLMAAYSYQQQQESQKQTKKED